MTNSDLTLLDNSVVGTEAEDEVPLSWLLAQPELRLRPIHVVESAVMVSWVHAIELDEPSPWLRAGGLVLTTGLRLPRGKGPQAQYVESLVRAGAVGLGFGTGLRFDAVPAGVVDACRDQGLSLVEVPLPTPFLAVTQAVSDRISQQRRWRVQQVLDAQRSLTRSALKGGPPAVVRTLSRLLRAGVDLVDADLVPLASAGPTGTGAGADVRETQPLGSPRARTGRLDLVRGTAPSPSERLVLNHAVSLLSLDLAQLQRPPEEDSASLLGALLGPAGFDPAAAVAAARFDPEEPVVLIGVLAAEPARTGVLIAHLRRNLPNPHLYGAAPLAHAGPERFFLTPEGSAASFEHALVEAADRREHRLTLAVGMPAPLQRIGVTLPGVLRLLAHAPAPAERVNVIRLVDAQRRDLLPAETWSELASAIAPWTDLLESHDSTHGTKLRESLEVYLSHHGRPDPTARALGIHRHTLRHRLARAQRIGGFDLDDPSHRALLVLALQGRGTDPR